MQAQTLSIVPSADLPPAPASRNSAVPCSDCAMRDVCMPGELTRADFDRLDALICSSRKVVRGETLHRAGDRFQNIYAIKAGAFKTVTTLRNGREQITGFQITGEPLGMEGIHDGCYTCDAVALEDSVLCIIPFGKLEELCNDVPVMQRHLHKLMSGEIVRKAQLMTLLGSMRAEERVAAFLLNLSQRLRARRYSGSEFKLRMSREEIGSYLGMTLETVSRTLSRLQEEKLIAVSGKLIRILDPEGLQRI
jgi:CRP/FNR family transcriptional regulator